MWFKITFMNKFYIIGATALMLIIGGSIFAGSNKTATMAGDTNLECLEGGHQNVALHIHPNLSITVDGESEEVPANIGITNVCMAEIHTHDSTGTIHIETVSQERMDAINFADFFTLWGKEIDREGYALEILYNGEAVPTLADIPLEDLGKIELVYQLL